MVTNSATRRRVTGWLRPRGLAGFVAVRVILAAMTLVAVSVIVFAATQLLPGNAAKAKLGKQATAESLAALEKQLGLDQSALTQYGHFVGGLLRGDPGNSLTSGQPIMNDLAPRLVNSAFLVVVAAAISIPLSLLIGSIAALRRDGILDEVSSFLQRVLASIPEFVIGLAMIALFATSVFHFFPAVSIIPPGSRPWSDLDAIWLPALTLVLVVTPNIALIMRAAMIEVLESDYVEAARLTGVPERRIVVRHALPNALAPAFQVIALNLAYLAGGVIVVEAVFSYTGVGIALRDAVLNRDFPTAQVVTMIITAVYVVTNLAADVATILVTPRLRTGLG